MEKLLSHKITIRIKQIDSKCEPSVEVEYFWSVFLFFHHDLTVTVYGSIVVKLACASRPNQKLKPNFGEHESAGVHVVIV